VQSLTAGAHDVIVETIVLTTVDVVDPAGIDVIEAGPETVEVGWTTEEMMEDEAVMLGWASLVELSIGQRVV